MEKKILELVKKNKKYRYLDDSLINDKIRKRIKNEKLLGKREVESIVKEVRGELHSSYGSFQLGKKKREKLLEKKDFLSIMKTNVSTKERLNYYEDVYKKIFSITGKPAKIVDLGCGLNVFSFQFMRLKKLEYYGYDIGGDDVEFINKFIKMNSKISGKAFLWNALSDDVDMLPKCDVVFMFKLLDSLGKDYKFNESLILKVMKKTKFIVASFPTIKLSNRKMKFKERRWLEYMLERVGLKFEKFEIENEIFYVVSKK